MHAGPALAEGGRPWLSSPLDVRNIHILPENKSVVPRYRYAHNLPHDGDISTRGQNGNEALIWQAPARGGKDPRGSHRGWGENTRPRRRGVGGNQRGRPRTAAPVRSVRARSGR